MPRKKKVIEQKNSINDEEICVAEDRAPLKVSDTSKCLSAKIQYEEALDKIKDVEEPAKSYLAENLRQYFSSLGVSK